MSTVDDAERIFLNGGNCSQAVCASLAAKVGLKQEDAMRIGCGFGGGMRMAETCGAVTGAIMALGARYGNADLANLDGKQVTYAKVQEFLTRFRKAHGTTCCRELLGVDVTTPEGFKQASEGGAQCMFKTKCPRFVRTAAEIAESLV